MTSSTQSKKLRFRSEPEASWAAFFDALRIEYEYQSEQVGIFSPDFYLPALDSWIEVANEQPLPSLAERLERFAAEREGGTEGIPGTVFVFWGRPDFQTRIADPNPSFRHHFVVQAKQIALRDDQARKEEEVRFAQFDSDWHDYLESQAQQEPDRVYDPTRYEAEYQILEELRRKYGREDDRNPSGGFLQVEVNVTEGYEGLPGGDFEHFIGKLQPTPFAWAECTQCRAVELHPICQAHFDPILASYCMAHPKAFGASCDSPILLFESKRIRQAYSAVWGTSLPSFLRPLRAVQRMLRS